MDIDENNPHRSPKRDLSSNADRDLWEAVKTNDQRHVLASLARGANVNARDQDGRTPLFDIVLWGNETAVAKQLLAHGADVHARDKTGQTPLHAAAAFGDEGHVRLLLDHGAEIDARSVAGRTPLHLAAILGRVEEASFLVSRGADLSIRDRNSETPLHLALTNVEKHLQEPFKRLLGGFITAEVVEARPDSLILRVETVHSKFPEAEQRAKERGTLTVPCGIFHEASEPGQVVRCQKGLTPGLDEAWTEARRKAELGIERER
jgi:Ankyrin repeats (3 copies)/Ankyrin repeat